MPERVATALRLLLPVCLIAASAVAVTGLWRVLGRTTPAAPSEQVTSLQLGGPGAAPAQPQAAVAPPPAGVPHSPASPAPAAKVTAAVTVVNASRVSGLARRTADALRTRGITVVSVGNLTAVERPARRTVYYAPGTAAQARTLARLAGGAAVLPAPATLGQQPGAAPAGRLVLVVTAPA